MDARAICSLIREEHRRELKSISRDLKWKDIDYETEGKDKYEKSGIDIDYWRSIRKFIY